MPSKEEMLRRKAIKKALAAKELTELRESMPLTIAALDALITHVDEFVRSHGCDHSLRHARAFMTDHELDEDKVVHWLNGQGGFCDCEVVLNVSQTLSRVTGCGEMIN
jgi:hypothetical protein